MRSARAWTAVRDLAMWLSLGACGRLQFDPIGAPGRGDGGGDLLDGGGEAIKSRMALGNSHTCILLAGGEVRCWGSSNFGERGDGTLATIGDDEPARAAGKVPVGEPVLALAAGGARTCAFVGSDVWCWGDNVFGSLGYGNTNAIGDDEPASAGGVIAVGGTVVELVLGAQHTCARLTTGAVRCWGRGTVGALGYGNTNAIGDDELPAAAGDVPIAGQAVQLAAGTDFTCALLLGGRVRCWGDASLGRLGYGNLMPIGDTEPASTGGDVALGESTAQIVTGAQHTCALSVTGTVRCWGDATLGQLGHANTNTIGDDELPTAVGPVELGGPATFLAAQGYRTCAVMSTGGVRCWGGNLSGELGYGIGGNVGDDELPTSVGELQLGGTVVELAIGFSHACVVLTGDAVRCWGYGGNGALGYGSTNSVGDDEVPAIAGDVPYL